MKESLGTTQSDDELRQRAYKKVIELCEDSMNRNDVHMMIQCSTCSKCKTCKDIRTINASSSNDFREQQVMEQMIKFIPGKKGNPGHFISPLPLKPFNINSVKGNKSTADEQNKQMVLKLQKDPEALKQVKDEMKKLQDLGFIVKLKELPKNIQEELKKDFKHYIPTTIAYKETSASTKTRICWDSSRRWRESASLNSILLKGSAEYSVVKMLFGFVKTNMGSVQVLKIL